MVNHVIQKHLTKVNKGKKGDNKPEWIILHFVGASGQAMDNAEYFEDVYRGASAGYFVDPKVIVQVVEDDTPSWTIGDGKRTRKGKHNGYVNKGGATSTNSINIELCQDTSTGKDAWDWEFHPDTVDKAEWLVRKKQKEHDIDDAHVIRHFDATGKPCPGNWQDNNWAKWWEFKDRLEKDIKQPAPSATPKDEGKHDETGMYLVEPGDTVGTIAKAHKVKVADIVEWNKLKNKNLIFPETKLFVSKPPIKDKPVTNPATPTVAPKPAPVAKSIDQLAKEVIDGKHGSGDAREKSVGSQYDAVQKRVNELLAPKVSPKPQPKSVDQLAKEVIDGKHGSGDARKKSLGSQYDAVQLKVNQLTSGKSKPTTSSLDKLVAEVIRGEHGSGRERMLSLGKRYTEVQREVNRRSR